jgi:hypothetical protein
MHTEHIHLYTQLYLIGYFITMLILINTFKIRTKVQDFNSNLWASIIIYSAFFPVFWILLLCELLVFLLIKLWKILVKERKFKYLNLNNLIKKNE